MSNWYVYIDSETQGPFPEDKIKSMIQSGKISADTNIMKEGTKEWIAAGSSPDFKGKTSNQKNLRNDIIDEEGLCPTCGYFTGSLLTCPRCGARVKNKIALATVKKIAIIGSIIGVIFLWYAARMKQPTLIKAAEVDEQMNGAYVTIVGKVVSYNEDEGKDTLKMKVDDGSGQPIGINAFKKLKQIKQI
nr:DUF4339 domain-containing protein [Candidatus Dependentiae bacterium]